MVYIQWRASYRESAEQGLEEDTLDLYDDEPATDVEIRAVHWFKIMSGTSVSEMDHAAFRRWLAEDEKHQTVYLELRDLWGSQYFELALQEKKNALEKRNMDQVFGRETAVATEERVAREDTLASIERKLRRLPSLGAYTAVAACFVLAAFAWVIQLSNTAQLQSVPYQTSVGELRRVTLSDGSIVNLNTNTQIYVSFDEGYRKVALSRGEAYFDVVKDGRPFIVEGGTGLVKVVGTAFEVRVDSDHMEVLVERGRVAVSPEFDEARYTEVTPRRQVAVIRHRLGEVESQPLDTPVADWRDGWLEFKDNTLGEVISELDKYYSGSIRLQEDISHIRIDGKYSVDVHNAVRALAMNLELDYATTDSGDIVLFMPRN